MKAKYWNGYVIATWIGFVGFVAYWYFLDRGSFFAPWMYLFIAVVQYGLYRHRRREYERSLVNG